MSFDDRQPTTRKTLRTETPVILPNGDKDDTDRRPAHKRRMENHPRIQGPPDGVSTTTNINHRILREQQHQQHHLDEVSANREGGGRGDSSQGSSLSAGARQVAEELSGLGTEAATEVLKESLKVCHSVWQFSEGQMSDCYEKVAGLHERSVHLLTKFAFFSQSSCDRYLHASDSKTNRSSVIGLGVTISAIEELLGVKEFTAQCSGGAEGSGTPIQIGYSDCRGFLWDFDKNSVPSYIERVPQMGDVVVLTDCMLTNAGIPQIVNNTGRDPVTGHLWYGRGICMLINRPMFPLFRKAGYLRLDDLVAVSVMLSPKGPQVIQVHVAAAKKTVETDAVPMSGSGAMPRDQQLEELCEWLQCLWPAMIPTILSISGPNRHHLAPMLVDVGWELKDDVLPTSLSSASQLGGGGGGNRRGLGAPTAGGGGTSQYNYRGGGGGLNGRYSFETFNTPANGGFNNGSGMCVNQHQQGRADHCGSTASTPPTPSNTVPGISSFDVLTSANSSTPSSGNGAGGNNKVLMFYEEQPPSHPNLVSRSVLLMLRPSEQTLNPQHRYRDPQNNNNSLHDGHVNQLTGGDLSVGHYSVSSNETTGASYHTSGRSSRNTSPVNYNHQQQQQLPSTGGGWGGSLSPQHQQHLSGGRDSNKSSSRNSGGGQQFRSSGGGFQSSLTGGSPNQYQQQQVQPQHHQPPPQQRQGLFGHTPSHGTEGGGNFNSSPQHQFQQQQQAHFANDGQNNRNIRFPSQQQQQREQQEDHGGAFPQRSGSGGGFNAGGSW